MIAQLNRLMALLTLCGLSIRPVLAESEHLQTVVVDGDTLVVPMADPRPAGLQTMVVDGDTLIVQVLVDPRPEADPPVAASDQRLVGPAKAVQEAARSDSLSEKMEAIVKRNERIAKKVVVGALSGLITTLVAVRVQDKILEPRGEPDVDAWRAIGFLFYGTAIGCSVGFPLGVTLVDPYDSLSQTLLAGVIPGVVGINMLRAADGTGFLVAYVGPITSLYASEKWRKPPQDRRVSFGLAPTFNGGFSAVAQLRF